MAGAACSLIFWSFSMAALSLDLGSMSASNSALFRDATRSRISRSRAAAWSSALAWAAAPAEGVNQPTPMARTTPATNTVAGREHWGIDMAVHPPSRARMGSTADLLLFHLGPVDIPVIKLECLGSV